MLSPIDKHSTLLAPSYDNIPPMERRRMSAVLKMSLACAVDCLEQAELAQPDAIIVGTAMGCCIHTKEFLDRIFESNGGLLAPTYFIHSTHNSIAGQISLHLKNYNYNMTHTQGSLSFEQALLDAMLGLGEGLKNVLVGGADEVEPLLYNLPAKVNRDEVTSGIGSGFFLLSEGTSAPGKPELVDVESISLIDDIDEAIVEFVRRNSLPLSEIDLVLYSGNKVPTLESLLRLFAESKLVDYDAYAGTWLASSAFAMGYAVDALSVGQQGIRTVLICNNLVRENLGLILLKIS